MAGHGAALSSCCARIRVRVMAYRALRGDKKALSHLADAICDSDPHAAEAAMAALRTPVTPAVHEAFCAEVTSRDCPALFRFALQADYIPSDPAARALFLFLSGEQDRFPIIDPFPHPALAKAYRDAPAGMRSRVRNAARHTGRSAVFARMFMGDDGRPETSAWVPDEWELVLAGLAKEKAWADLWQILFSAPVGSALAALHAIRSSGWTPPGDDRSVWEGIKDVLPDAWQYPVLSAGAEQVFEAPDHQVLRFAFSPDSRLLATGDSGGRVRIWHAGRGALVCTLPSAGDDPPASLLFSPDGKQLLVCGSDGVLRNYRASDGALLWSNSLGRSAITCCSPEDTGFFLLAANKNGEVFCIDTATGRQEVLAGGRRGAVTALARLPGGYTAAGYADGAVCVIPANGAEPWLAAHPSGDPVNLLVPSPDNAGLLVLCSSTPPSLRDIRTGELLQAFTGTSGRASCFAAAPDASWFAVGADDCSHRIWVQRQKEPEATVPFYRRGVISCMAIAGSALLACGYSDGFIRTIRVPEGTPAESRKAHTKAIAAISCSPDGRLLAVSGWDRKVTLHDPGTLKPLRTLSGQAGGVAALSLSPCGTYAAAGYQNGTAVVYDCRDGSIVLSFPLYSSRVKTTILSPDGTLLASAGDDSSLRLWNVRDGSLVAVLEGLTSSVSALAFSPDGKVCLAGGWDGKLRSWTVPDGGIPAVVPCHTSTITCCVVSPSGTFIVTGSNDTTVAVRGLPGMEPLAVISGSGSEVGAVALSPAGDLLAAGGADGVARLYLLPGGEDAGTIPLPPGTVTALAFTCDGTVLAAGYEAGTIVLLSVPEQRLIHVAGTHGAAVSSLCVTPCGTGLVSGGADGTVRRFPLPWTRPLSATMPEDVSALAVAAPAPGLKRGSGSGAGSTAGNGDRAERLFLYRLLAARFRNEVGLCIPEDDPGAFDIRIAG